MPDPTVPRWTPETEQELTWRIFEALQAGSPWAEPLTREVFFAPESEQSRANSAKVMRPVLVWLADAGLLVTPEMTAVLEAAREERRLQRTEPRWIDSDEWFRWDERRAEAAKATAAAVDALEAPHPDTTGAAG